MFKKLAILVVEKADGSISLSAGEKGDVATMARDLIRETNDTPAHDVARITALGEAGVLKQRKYKANVPATLVEVATESVEVEDEDLSADADKIRAALKEKGVKVPPRISLDKLVEMAVQNGVEV